MEGLLTILNEVGLFISANPWLGYFLLGIAFLIRGEVVVLISTYLTMMGYLSWFIAAPVVLVSMYCNDYLLYFLGKWIHDSNFGQNIKQNYIFPKKLERYFKRNFIKSMFLVRFAIGLTTIVMFLSGWSRINIKRFFKIHLISSIFWLSVYTLVGFSLIKWFGYLKASEMVGSIEVVILCIIGFIIVLEYVLQRIIRRKSGMKNFHPLRKIFKNRFFGRGENNKVSESPTTDIR